MTVDSKSKPFFRQETWVQRGWGSVLRSHSFIWSGSPHSPPQGPLHYEAQADVLPPLSFSYSESKIALLPQKHLVSVFLIKKKADLLPQPLSQQNYTVNIVLKREVNIT